MEMIWGATASKYIQGSGYFKSNAKRERVEGVRGKESVKERKGAELVSRYSLEI